ncbi:MAG: lipopolysaccharide biosynthesis protein, partial [Flavobacteriales bacterium]|nr:lipopolysaccharide biosynthesis protein [Flavobacteriales bacterium]
MSNYNDEIELKDILIGFSDYRYFLFKKKFYIIIFSAIFSLFGLLYAFISDSEYHADLTFIVEKDAGAISLGSMSGIASQFGFDFGGNEGSTFSQSNILELLKSRRVIVSTLMQSAK